MLLPFEKLPIEFQNDSVKKYYDILYKKRRSIFVKRAVDLVLSIIMLVFLIIPMLVIAVCVKSSSKGPVFYRQERVTTYNKKFMILKFFVKIGFFITFISFLAIIYLVIDYFVSHLISGWTSIIVSICFFSGLLMATIGVVGIYVGNIFMQSKGRPLYIIRDILNKH